MLVTILLPAVAAPAQSQLDPSGIPGGGDAVHAGATAWAAGDYARALVIWRPLAAAGNAYAQYDMGQAHRLGRGVTIDQKAAQDWYYKAAVQDHPQALANYGLLLFQGGDRKAALPWLRKAADRGDPRAQYVVGTALFNGDIVGKDWVRAYAFMTRAAAAHLPPAVTSLAEMDRYVPLQQRSQGTALARDLARNAALAMNDGETGSPSPPSAPPQPPRTVTMRRQPEPDDMRAARPATPPPVRSAKVAPPAPSPAGDGGWRIQLGAFGDQAAAEKAWNGAAGKLPGLRSHLVRAGAVTRLQAGPFAGRAEAGKACARITAAGSACFPVQAN